MRDRKVSDAEVDATIRNPDITYPDAQNETTVNLVKVVAGRRIRVVVEPQAKQTIVITAIADEEEETDSGDSGA